MLKKTISFLCLPAIKNTALVLKEFPFHIKLTSGTYKDIAFVFHKNSVKILHKKTDIQDFSFVWLASIWDNRDIAYAIKLYLQKTKTPHTYVEKSTSKITDTMIFALNKIPIPDTIFLDHTSIKQNIKNIKKTCGYPLIIKDTKGSRGKFSLYIESEDELLQKITTLPKNKKFLLQRFIPKNYYWGIMVADGKVVAGKKSYPGLMEFEPAYDNDIPEEFFNITKIPIAIKKIALTASKKLDLKWSRTDIIVDKNTKKPYILEVNRFPYITAKTMEVSGAHAFLKNQPVFKNAK